MSKSWTLLIAAVIAGLGHSMAPDHWLTYVLTAKAKNLSRFQAMLMTVTGGLSHLVSTVILGLVITYIGQHTAQQYTNILNKFVSAFVIFLGLYFIGQAWLHLKKHPTTIAVDELRGRHCGSGYAIGVFLGIRACPEAIPIFLAISTRGVFTSLTAIGTWVLVTVGALAGIVWLSLRSLECIRLTWLERYGELLSGLIIILIGLITIII